MISYVVNGKWMEMMDDWMTHPSANLILNSLSLDPQSCRSNRFLRWKAMFQSLRWCMCDMEIQKYSQLYNTSTCQIWSDISYDSEMIPK